MASPDFQYTIRAPMVRDAFDQENRDRELEDHLNTYVGSGTGNLELGWSNPGVVRLSSGTPYYVSDDRTLISTWVGVGVTSSSGSITVRLTINAVNYDTTITAGTTTGATPTTRSVSVPAGTVLIPEITAKGTDATRLSFIAVLEPA